MSSVFIRGNKSIKSITLTRIAFLLPLILYGFYKNGIVIYQKNLTGILGMFKPLAFIGVGAFSGLLANIIYEKIIKRNKNSLMECIFSSFHIEYGILIACISSINSNFIVFSITTFILLLISKFLNNRINIICFIAMVIYLINYYIGSVEFKNAYETFKSFDLNAMDYILGKGIGGICATNILFIIIALVGLYYTNNNKTTIALSGLFTILLLFTIYSITTGIDYKTLIFSNNMIFLLSFVATDSVTSCYTIKGKRWFGTLISLLMFGFYFVNPIIGPCMSIIIVSLFNNLIDRKLGK